MKTWGVMPSMGMCCVTQVSISTSICQVRLPKTQNGALYSSDRRCPERFTEVTVGGSDAVLGSLPTVPEGGHILRISQSWGPRPEAIRGHGASGWQRRVALKPLAFSLCPPSWTKAQLWQRHDLAAGLSSVPGRAKEPDRDFRVSWAGEAGSSPSMPGGFKVTPGTAERLGLLGPVLEPPGSPRLSDVEVAL